MNDNYIISVIGTQTVDGEKNTIELTTAASYMEKNGRRLIKYREYDPDNGENYAVNIIKIESKEKIILVKNNHGNIGQLILESGKRHQCLYDTPVGSMSIGIFTDTVSLDIDENGGKIEIDYTIDFNADFQSDNHMKIILKKKEK